MTLGRKKTALALAGFVLSLGFAAAPIAAQAFQIVPLCATDRGSPGKPPEVPTLNCALQTFGNIAQFILGITGSFALLMFVYGGFTMLTSAGSPDKVSKGKTILTNALIGIIIIFSSGTLISYGLNKVGLSGSVKIIGAACSEGAKNGTYFEIVTGEGKREMKCAATCSDLTAAGYACTASSTDLDLCITGLCPGDATHRCCKKQAK